MMKAHRIAETELMNFIDYMLQISVSLTCFGLN